ncbi:MAG: DNA internalization-related competence protein ComEC/Rec2 [Candidatus Margulisiibacteriota bacterium]
MNKPIIVLSVAYILGIIVAKYLFFPIFTSLLLFSFILIVLFWLLIKNKNITSVIPVLFIFLGILNYQIRSLPPPKNDISNLPKYKLVTIVGLVENNPNQYENSLFFNLKVTSVDNYRASGRLSVISQAASLEYGDIIQIQGCLEPIEGLNNPGLLSFSDYLENQGIYCQLKTASFPIVLQYNRGNPLICFSQKISKRLMIIPQKTLPPYYATLQNSIILGTQAAKAPPEMKEAYKRAGVAHLLVVSGMQVALIVGICMYVFRSIGVALLVNVLITSVINVLFVLMTGAGASILRAALMVEIMLLGKLFEREGEIYTTMSLSLLILLMIDPRSLFDIGLQLSYAATWSLIYAAPVMQEKLAIFLPKAITSLFGAALAPMLATIPITLYCFGQFPVIGLLTNILLLPWINCVVILGFVAYLVGLICLPLAEVVNSANLLLLIISDWIVNVLAKVPFAQIFFPAPKYPIIIAYYLGLVAFIEVLRKGSFPKFSYFRKLISVLILVAIFFWNFALSDEAGDLLITVLDVGQGDAILIESPAGKKMLIDGGPEHMGEKVIIPFLQKKGVNRLDVALLSHAHDDHSLGIREVARKIAIGAYISQHSVRVGEKVTLGGGVLGNILFYKLNGEEDANCSIEFKLTYGRFSMLFTGDNEIVEEEEMLSRLPPSVFSATILKVGHHGSRTSSTDQFLGKVCPQVAIISCGRHNKFRHPHKITLDKFNKLGIKLYRTDLQGAITIKSDGNSYSILTQK